MRYQRNVWPENSPKGLSVLGTSSETLVMTGEYFKKNPELEI